MTKLPTGLSDSELRAFQFGPELRRIAQEHFNGSLDEALEHVEQARVEQHWRDVHSIRLEHRRAYVRLIEEAYGRPTNVALTPLAEAQAQLRSSVDEVVTAARFELAVLFEDGLPATEDLGFHVFAVADRDYIMTPASGGIQIDTCTYEETDGRTPDGLAIQMPRGDSEE